MIKNDPQPETPGVLSLYIDAFFDLSSERSFINGYPGAIPVTRIMDYVNYYDFINKTVFIDVIQSVDLAYLTHLADRARENAPKQP
jgi:hypothetical protein